MAELALGVLGTAGLFSATLDIWSFVDAGQGYAQSFTRLCTRLDLQRTLFINWGKSVGFGTEEGYHPKLDEAPIQSTIRLVLTEIYVILSETDVLESRYGLRVLDKSEEQRPITIGRRLLSSGLSASIFRPKYEEYRLRLKCLARGSEETCPEGGVQVAAARRAEAIRERQRNSSIWMKTKWAIRDEEKMEKLICDLAELVSGLRTLTVGIVDGESERAIAAETVSDIDSVDSLRRIQEASREVSPLSVSVSERIRSLESGPSGATTFYSARSCARDVSVADSVYGTSQLPRGTYFPESTSSGDDQHRKPEADTSHKVQRHALGSLEERDVFAHGRDSGSKRTSQISPKEVTSSCESDDKLMPLESAPRQTDGIRYLSATSRVEAESSSASRDQFQTQDVFTLDEVAEPLPTAQELGEAAADAVGDLDTYGPWSAAGVTCRPMTVTVDGPASTPYFGGIFHMRARLGQAETAEIGEKKVTVRYVHVLFVTRICHPLIDDDGYFHGRYFLRSDPLEKEVPDDARQRISTMMARVLRYCGWDGVQGGERWRIDELQKCARKYTLLYASRYAWLLPHDRTEFKRLPQEVWKADLEDHSRKYMRYGKTHLPMEKRSQEGPKHETWSVFGPDGVSMVLLGYRSEPRLNGQLIPNVCLKASNPGGIFVPGSLFG